MWAIRWKKPLLALDGGEGRLSTSSSSSLVFLFSLVFHYSFLEIGGITIESKKENCRVKNGVIEVGEEEKTQILSAPNTKHLT